MIGLGRGGSVALVLFFFTAMPLSLFIRVIFVGVTVQCLYRQCTGRQGQFNCSYPNWITNLF